MQNINIQTLFECTSNIAYNVKVTLLWSLYLIKLSNDNYLVLCIRWLYSNQIVAIDSFILAVFSLLY